MAKDRQLSEEEINKIRSSMTYEQWAVYHLLFIVFMQQQKEEGVEEMSLPFVEEYIEKASEYIRDLTRKTQPKKVAKDMLYANYSMSDVLPRAFDGHNERNFELWKLFAFMTRKLLLSNSEYLEGKSFIEAFPDIFFTKEGYANSPKAAIIVSGMVKEFQNIVNGIIDGDYDEWDDIEYGPLDELMDACEDSWESVKFKLSELKPENALVFHAMNILISDKYLQEKLYSKYKKNVVKAFVTFKGSFNPKQKEFAIRNAGDALEKLKDKVLDLIDEVFDEDYDNAIKYGTFSLATDYSLMHCASLINQEKAQELFKDISIVNEDIKVEAPIERYAEYVCGIAKTDMDQILTEENEDLDEDCPTEEDAESGKKGNGKERPIMDDEMIALMEEGMSIQLESLDLQRDIAFHMISLNIMTQNYPEDFYFDYKKDINKLISDYFNETAKVKKESARKKADEAYIKVSHHVSKMIQEVGEGVLNPTLEKYSIMDMTTLMVLNQINGYEKKIITRIIKDITFDKEKDQYTSSLVEEVAQKFKGMDLEDVY